MSEDLTKKFLLEEYRENGGTREISELTVPEIINEVRNQKDKKKLIDEIDTLKKNAKAEPPKKPILGIDPTGRDNVAADPVLSDVYAHMSQYVINDKAVNVNDPYHEHYKRDNELLKTFKPGEGVILRDADGKVA